MERFWMKLGFWLYLAQWIPTAMLIWFCVVGYRAYKKEIVHFADSIIQYNTGAEIEIKVSKSTKRALEKELLGRGIQFVRTEYGVTLGLTE